MLAQDALILYTLHTGVWHHVKGKKYKKLKKLK